MYYRFAIFCVVVLFLSCNSIKRNQRFLAQGNYDRAIDLAVKKLEKDKNSEKNDGHILLLEEAFKKAVDDDMRRLNFLKKENNPKTSREKYSLYTGLVKRQNMIRPLLPLYSNSLGRNGKFKFKNYDDELIESKKQLLGYLYQEANFYMNNQNTLDYRTAYSIYCEIEELQSNYRDVKILKEDAQFYGTDFVYVTLDNHSGQMMPYRLEKELLDFNTYGLNDLWTVYHSEKIQDVDYNYGIALQFLDIGVSPERILEREVVRSKQIKDGWTYKKDRNGAIIKDAEGNPIKIDKIITVNAQLIITEQTKSVLVAGDVSYTNLVTHSRINRYPLATEFIFENIFATYNGDKRALTNEDLNLINNRFIYFPTTEQMILDAGDDIKLKLKEILKEHSIR